MKLYRIKIKPLSPWRTVWQSDTLAGSLCWMLAQSAGADVLRREVLEKCVAGNPPFVLSDAFPADFLPVPEIFRLREWRDEKGEDLGKRAKRAKFVSRDRFQKAQSGASVFADELLEDEFFRSYAQTRNRLDRLTDTTRAGSLYALGETVLNPAKADFLSVYARIADGFEKRLLEMFQNLSSVGFGADVSAGKGQFEILSDNWEDAGFLDAAQADGCAVLSTFQPAENDSTTGVWEAFAKFGKVGAGFGLPNVFKRPLVMFRAGACFASPPNKEFCGRAVPMNELVAPPEAETLRQAGAEIFHFAYGLSVPFSLGFKL